MKMGGRTYGWVVILPILCLFLLTGCTFGEEPETAFEAATRLYREGRYEEAEPLFLQALEAPEADDLVKLGHGYNLIALGENDKGIDELIKVRDSVGGTDTHIAVRRTLLAEFLKEGSYMLAAMMYDELSQMPGIDVNSYSLEASVIRLDTYRTERDYDKLREELYNVIALKAFAQEEYVELYSISCLLGEREQRMALADEIEAYINSHSSYITDYKTVVGIMLDAADLSGRVEWVNGPDHYYEAALTLAECGLRSGALSDGDILKYKVIVSERQGKKEIAYNLLGVYLNHCPDDEMAQKELNYLGQRQGVGTR